MSPEKWLSSPAALAVCASVALLWLVLNQSSFKSFRRRVEKWLCPAGSSREEMERRAKASFRVRRSELRPSLSKKRGKRRKCERGVGDSPATRGRFAGNRSTWSSILSAVQMVPSFRGNRLAGSENPDAKSNGIDTACVANSEKELDDDTDSVAVVGMDCEMVGCGRDGFESILARCSIVMLASPADSRNFKERNDDGASDDGSAPKSSPPLMSNIRVLYDKAVRPTKRVVDYRTKHSGMTRLILRGEGDLTVVPFEVCRREVSEIFASLGGKPVVVVGHALINDFEALRLRHPDMLTRDTATYRPFMREGRRRMLQRKLSHLTEEKLGVNIQNSSSGHSSVEDAAAALQLYWKERFNWEKSLGHPLRALRFSGAGSEKGGPIASLTRKWEPLNLYLDGCNLPLGMREMRSSPTGDVHWQLTSKTSARGTEVVRVQIDWIPLFKSALTASAPSLSTITIMFDGAKYQNWKKERPRQTDIFANLCLEITELGVQVDDVLVERCIRDLSGSDNGSCTARNATTGIVSIENVIGLLENMSDLGYGAVDHGENDNLKSYIVVRRKGGGSKSRRRLFDKLNLRRPEEGALCLTALTARLQKNSLKIARELQRARVHGIVEYEVRRRSEVRSVVVTDDVLLADRLVKEGAIVLSYKQMQQMF